VSVDLARTQNPRQMPDAEKEDATVVAITRDGKIYLGAHQIAVEEITTKVKDVLTAKLDKTVYMKSDARARYGDVVKVVDALRAAGVDSLGLWTERIERRNQAQALP
jgi:biopolymer transport protein TolR